MANQIAINLKKNGVRIIIGTFLIFFFMISCQNSNKKNTVNETDNTYEELEYKKIETNNSLDLKYIILDEYNEQVPFYKLNQIAEYPGGFDSLRSYIVQNFEFPTVSDTINITGKVRTTFCVDTLGKVVEVKLIRGFLQEMDEACLDVIKKIPDWKPAEIGKNKKVKMKFELPFTIVYED